MAHPSCQVKKVGLGWLSSDVWCHFLVREGNLERREQTSAKGKKTDVCGAAHIPPSPGHSHIWETWARCYDSWNDWLYERTFVPLWALTDALQAEIPAVIWYRLTGQKHTCSQRGIWLWRRVTVTWKWKRPPVCLFLVNDSHLCFQSQISTIYLCSHRLIKNRNNLDCFHLRDVLRHTPGTCRQPHTSCLIAPDLGLGPEQESGESNY